MYRKSLAHQDCSIARSLDVVGEWWTLLIVRDAFRGVRRFDDFSRSLGIARNVLASRLAKLVDHGILERHPVPEHQGRFEYRLTRKGRELQPVVIALMRWGDRWTSDGSGPPVVLRHQDCGHVLEARLTCAHCGGEVDADNVRRQPEPRPAAP